MRASANDFHGFDTAALAGPTTIGHRMPESGEYRVEARAAGRVVAGILVRITASGPQSTLFEVASGFGAGDAELAPGGWLTIRGQGARAPVQVTVADQNGEPYWDAASLAAGDLIVSVTMRPGGYSLTNHRTGSHRAVRVVYPDPRVIANGGRWKSEPVRVAFGEDADAANITLDPGQPLVVEVHTPGRIALALTEPDDGPADLREWRERRTAEVLARLGGS